MELEELETGSVIKTFNSVVILKTDEFDISASVNNILEVCQEFTGKKQKIKVDKLGNRKLAYKIKDTYEEGYYMSIYWRGTTENVTELERILRIDDNVLKFLTVKVDGEEYELQEFAAIEEESEQDVSQDAWDVIFNN